MSKLEEAKNRYKNRNTKTSTKSSNLNKAKQRYRAKELNLDTLETDLNSLGTTIKGIYDGWQTEETMNNTRSSIESMYNRLIEYQDYRKTYGITEGDDDVNKLVKAYKSTLNEWDSLTAYYGGFKDANAFKKAEKAKEDEKKRREEMGKADLDAVKGEITDLENILKKANEYNTSVKQSELKGKTDELKSKFKPNFGAQKPIPELDIPQKLPPKGPALDFESPLPFTKNSPSKNVEEFMLEDYLKGVGYSSVKEIEKALEDKKTYLKEAKIVQKDNYYTEKAKSGDGKKGYDKWFADKKEREKEPTYWELVFEMMGSAGNSSDPGAGTAQVINEKRKDKSYGEPTDEWTQEQKYEFGARYLEDINAAYDYGALINNAIAFEKKEASKAAISEASTDNIFSGIGNWAGSVVTAPMGLVDYFDDITDIAAGRNVIVEEGIVTPFEYSQTVRGAQTDYLNEWSGTLPEDIPVIGGKGVGDVYGLGSSIVDSKASAVALGPYGTLVNYFGQAAAAGVDDAVARGASGRDAVLYGGAMGLAEGIPEAISAKSFLKLGKAKNLGFWGKLNKQATEEAREEFTTSVLGNIADEAIMGDKSNFNAKVKSLMLREGISEEEAIKKAWLDATGDIAYDTLGGYISGGVSSIGVAAKSSRIEKAVKDKYGDSTDDLIAEGLESGKNTESYKLAVEAQEKVKSGEELTSEELVQLVAANDAAYKDEISVEAEKRLAKLGSTDDDATLAYIIAKKTTGEQLTKVEMKTLQASRYGNRVYNEINNEDLAAYTENMSESDADLFLSQYDGTSDISAYADSFNLASRYAEDDFSQGVILDHRGVLSTSQVQAIYNAKVHAKYEKHDSAIKAIAEKHGKKLFVQGTFDDSIIDRKNSTKDGSKVNWKDLTPTQRDAIKFAQLFSKATGVNIKLIKSDVKFGKHKGKNGSYDPATNTIELDVYAGRIDAKSVEDSIIPTLSHEITHWMKYKASAIYDAIRNDVMKTLAEGNKHNLSESELIEIEMKRLKEAHPEKNVTPEDAIDELVARACEDMLSNSTKARELLSKMSKTEQTKFIDKVKETFENLIQWVNDLLAHYKSGSEEAQILRNYKEMLDKISKQWDAMLATAIESNQALQNEGITGEELAEKYLATVDLQYNDRLVESHIDKLQKNYSEEAALPLKTLLSRYAKIVDMWRRLGGELNSEFLDNWNNKVGTDRTFSVFKAQAGYKYNIELSSMCKKGIPLFEAIDTIVKEEAMKELQTKTIGKAEKEILYDILKTKGFEIPCSICYVEQARQREGAIIDAFLNGKVEKSASGKVTQFKLGWNETLAEIQKEMQKAGCDYTFPSLDRNVATDNYSPADLSMDEETQKYFFAALKKVANKEISRYNKDEKKSRKLITNTDAKSINEAFKGKLPLNLAMFKTMFTEPSSRFMIADDLLYSSMTTQNLASNHNMLYSLFNSQGGVGGYKTKQGTIVYWADILGKKWIPSKLRDEGGVRNQSNSDLQMFTLLDHAQMYIDFTAKGYYLQAYTKVLAELKLFGLSKGKINASFIPKVVVYKNSDGSIDEAKTQENAGLDEQGNPIYDDVEGINHREAFMLIEDVEYSKSIGGVCIGYSDKHILKLLDDNRIQLIIGFHDKSNDTSKRYRGAVYAKNYNGINEATKLDKDGTLKTVHIGFNRFVKKAEGKFKGKSSVVYNGKTYNYNDIPKLAADLYLEHCESKGLFPAYSQGDTDFSAHPNYYKLLADFSLYDINGNYTPHQKVEYNMPDTVPYLDKDGKKAYMPTEDYVKKELKAELTVRDDISAKLADKSDDGIIPTFIREANALHDRMQSKNSDRDSEGNTLSAEQIEYFKDSKVRDADGNLLVVYHGTIEDFHIFDFSKAGKNGKAEGAGFYFSDETEITKRYGNIQKKVYLNITKPMYNNKRTVKKAELIKFVNDLIDFDSQKWESDWKDSFISNYVNTYEFQISRRYAVQQFVNQIWEYNTNDQDLIFEIAQADGRTYANDTMKEFYDILTESIGYDGIIAEWSHADGKSNVYVTFNSEQSKYTNNTTPTSNVDMRYSDRDSRGSKLSEEQIEFFKDSKVRDEKGRLLAVYHGTKHAGFTKFTKTDEIGYFFARTLKTAQTYSNHSKVIYTPDRYTDTDVPNEANYQVYLNIKKPYVIDGKGAHWDGLESTGEKVQLSIKTSHWGDDGKGLGKIVFKYGGKTYSKIIHNVDEFDAFISRHLNPQLAYAFAIKMNSIADKKGKGEYEANLVWDFNAHKYAESKNTRDIVRRAYNSEWDYDGVIFRNVVDSGDGSKIKADDLYVAFNSNQIKSTANTEPTSDPDIRYSERDLAPTFYSQMGKVVEGVKQEKLAANSVVNMLRGKGVKAEEIRWSGIVPFLEGKKSVTKQELLDFINGSMLQIGEQTSSNDVDLRYDSSNHTYRLYDKDGNVINTYTYNEFMGGYVSENDDEIYAYSTDLEDAVREEYGSMSSPRWSEYKLDGGSNYREIVFTMPNSTYRNQMMKVHWGDEAEGVLVHARIQDFNVNGKKMLFIEEIQSDWHNEGHKDGYKDGAKLKELEAKANEAFYALEDYSTELTGLAGEYEAVAKTQKGRELLQAKIRAEKELKQAQVQFDSKVPDAPFKGNYHEYVLKRLLRMAAEQGYDSIGWTPAHIQSERWSDEFAEGYRIEYDQDIPKFLKKYGRQWGAEVEKTMLDQGWSSEHRINLSKQDLAYWQNELSKATDEEADFIRRQIEITEKDIEEMQVTGESVWSMPITDSMKNSVLYEGQVMYSDRDDISVYDKLGEIDRLVKENEQLQADVERLKERLKIERQVTHGNFFNENQLNAVAGHIRHIADSNYDKKELVHLLNAIYQYIAHSPDLNWEDLYSQCYDVASLVLDKSKPITETNDYFKLILNDIRGKKISVNEQQIQNAKQRFGSRWHSAFFNRVTISENGISLDRQWQEWAAQYPDIFDAEISDADMLVELYDIYDNVREGSEIVVEYDLEERTRWLAREIYNQYWNVSTIRTTADKYDKQIRRLNFEHRKAMQELRNSHDARLKEQHRTDKEKAQRLVAELRKRKDEEITEVKKKSKERLDAYKENAERKTRIQSITSNALTLNKWLTTNSKDYHINETLKPVVINLLQAINFSSKRMLDKSIPTKKDISLYKALEDVKNMFASANNESALSDMTEMYGIDMDEEITKLLESSFATLTSLGDNEYILNQMSLDGLKTLDKVVKTIKQVVTKLNKFHIANHYKGVANLSQNSIQYFNKLGQAKTYDQASGKGKIAKLLNWNNLNPFYAFKKFGEGGKILFEALQDGQDKLAFNVKAIIDFAKKAYTNEEVREWSKSVKSVKVHDMITNKDVAVQITVAQVMSLYCSLKREQAKGHILGDGIRIMDIPVKKGKVISQADGVKLSPDDIDTLVNMLTKRQMQVADKLQEFMNTICTDWGNEISMARFGYNAFGEPNYFPISSDKNNLAVDDAKEENNSLFRLLNMSFTKSTIKGANNKIEIKNIFDVFAQHASDMAKYNAFALPILDFYKWYNYTEKGYVEGEKRTVASLKASLEKAFGKDAKDYITTFLRDINGQYDVSRDVMGKGFFTNAKIAAVGMNLRVVLLQPTSYIRASAVMGNKYLAKALLHKPKVSKAEQYCGMALWKSLGYYDTNIQRGVTELIKHDEDWKAKTVEWAMKGAEIADKLTWGYLWNACELEIRDTRKDLQVGSKEFYEAIGKRLREVIYATQVVDSTMTRSQMMRSPGMYDKMLTAFASEPTLAYNMLYDAVETAHLEKREKGKVSKENIKKMARVMVAYTMTNAVAALVESGFDAFRDEDDEEMDFAEFMKLYLSNFAYDMSITAKLPYIKEAVSFLQGFTSSRTDTQWMQSLGYALKGWFKVATGDGNPASAIRNSLRSLSYLSGLPFYNAYRDFLSMLDKLDILTAEELEEMLEDLFS